MAFFNISEIPKNGNNGARLRAPRPGRSEWRDVSEINTLKSGIPNVAVIVPKEKEETWWEDSSLLWRLTWNVDTTIEPVLLYEGSDSPLYYDVMKTGIVI